MVIWCGYSPRIHNKISFWHIENCYLLQWSDVITFVKIVRRYGTK